MISKLNIFESCSECDVYSHKNVIHSCFDCKTNVCFNCIDIQNGNRIRCKNCDKGTLVVARPVKLHNILNKDQINEDLFYQCLENWNMNVRDRPN